ncbi:MAG TPA: hypothetical protein VJP78_00490 [Thermoleophilia bacterium]|nr:hypothetical protein [Thermoleophilia bacterium]
MYLNQDFSRRMDGYRPLRYIDVDDPDLAEFPVLGTALASGRGLPLVLVGDEIKSPPAISVYWIEEQLTRLSRVGADGNGGGDN